MRLSNFRLVKFEEFPDYEVYLVALNRISNTGTASLSKYGFYGRYYGSPSKSIMPIKEFRKLSDAAGVPKDGSKLSIDSSCKIPVTLLKPRYTIITSRSSKTPDFTVIGQIEMSSYEFKIFVSDKLKKVLCVYEYNALEKGASNAPTLENYQWLFHSNIDELFDDYKSFHPYSGDLFDTFYLAPYSKGLYDFCNKILPDTAFVSEEKLVTGTNTVTSDMLCSSLKMMESPDSEIREAALLSLASSDYSKCRNVIGYLLSKYHMNDVNKLKNKSTAVKWMTKMCAIEKWRTYVFTSGEADFVKDYLEKTSQGKLTFNDSGRCEIHCSDVGFLMRNHDLVKKTRGLFYDLATANLVANNL